MISRRTLIKATPAMLLMPAITRASRAAPLSRSLPWAVTFDGNTYLTNPGTIGGFGTASRYLFVGFNYKCSTVPNYYLIFACPGSAQPPNSWENLFYVMVQQQGSIEQIAWGLGPNTNGDGLGVVGQIKTQFPSGQTRNVLLAFDTQGSVNFSTGSQTYSKAYVDGNSVPVAITGCGGRGQCDLFTPALNGLPWYVGGTPNGYLLGPNNGGPIGVNYVGVLADLSINQGQNLINNGGSGDIDDPVFRAVFYDANNEVASRQSSNGATPGMVMPSSIAPWSPQIFLSGNKDIFPTNFAQYGGGFTWPATFVPASGSFSIVGNLATAADDPFGAGF